MEGTKYRGRCNKENREMFEEEEGESMVEGKQSGGGGRSSRSMQMRRRWWKIQNVGEEIKRSS